MNRLPSTLCLFDQPSINYPYYGGVYSQPQHPIATLAEHLPEQTAGIIREALRARLVESRHETMRDGTEKLTANLIAMIHQHPGQNHFRAALNGGVHKAGWFSCEGENYNLTLTVESW